ncbi:UvrD-helicase domain-containing protein [Chloroflexota bacterium]
MTMAPIGHKAISASAGSGKTFQLAHRYIELMSKGVRPDRIIALTFSRKAAGEIFDSVVSYLCRAASSPEAALLTGHRIWKPDMTQQAFLNMLRELLESLHRLHIGTLDSFTVGIAKAFPMELGIPPRFQLLGEDGSAGVVRQQVLARVFSQGEVDRDLRTEFLEAYKQATFGQEEKGLGDRLDNLIAIHHGHYQVLPQAIAWGQEDRIWSRGSPWWKYAGERETVAGRLTDLLQEDGLVEKTMQRWQTFIAAVLKFGIGSSWPEDIDYLFGKLAPHTESLRAGEVSFEMDRARHYLSPEESGLALALMAHVVNTEISVAQQKTQGIYRLLDLYERFYDAMLRRQGRITFSDIQYLLTSGNSASGGSVISRLPSTEARLYIDYRLDCKLDHWLLDEFQDTSDLQWEVLQNLADEILQDSSGERSFFYVGDTKQAIYGWRGGNARLFDKLLERYEERIELSHLSTSFRSCRAVIDTVNRVFEHIPEGLLPDGAVRQWERSWQTHQCEEGEVPALGYAAIIEPSSDQGNPKPADEDRYRVVARLLREIDPLSKGLSVAILMRTNRNGEEIVDYLRRECPGMNILHEGRAFIKENPVVSVLLSLVKFAAHPGDILAWRHLQMSPLQKYFFKEKLNRQNLSPLLLCKLQADGFQALIREWGDRLDSVHQIDGFGRKRLGELNDAAIEFDGTGSRDCDSFLRFIDSYEIHDLASGEAIRVMTIHQSKGLGFDIVILPDLQKGNMAGGGRPGFVIARDPESEEPSWALDMPQRIIAESDAILAEQVKKLDETTAFDNLCLLYVAMTRTRQGLYLITCFPGKTSRTLTHAAFLKQQLAGDPKPVQGRIIRIEDEDALCLYETGDPEWYTKAAEKVEKPAPVEAPRLTPDFLRQPSARQRFSRIEPSKSEVIIKRADSLFTPTNRDNRDLGIALHQLFERISWIDDEIDIDKLVGEWSYNSSIKVDLKQKAIDLFRSAVNNSEIRDALTRPPGNVILWREKRFEAITGSRWLSGVFDRVVVLRDQNDKPIKATIIDFKSDEIPSDASIEKQAEHYRPQMELYRSALSRIIGRDPARIVLKLLFLLPGKDYELS